MFQNTTVQETLKRLGAQLQAKVPTVTVWLMIHGLLIHLTQKLSN